MHQEHPRVRFSNPTETSNTLVLGLPRWVSSVCRKKSARRREVCYRSQVRLCGLWQFAGGLALLLLLGAVTVVQANSVGAQDGQPMATLNIYLGKSEALAMPWPIKRVSVTDPNVADVMVMTPDQVLVLGKKIGSTDLLMWNEHDHVWRRRLNVTADVSGLKHTIDSLLPGSDLQLNQVEDSVVISGLLRRTEHTAQLHNLFDAAGLKLVDLTTVAGVHQVMLQVRVAEVNRISVRNLGANLLFVGDDFNFDITRGGAEATLNASLSVFADLTDVDLELFVDALAENRYLRVLAEPTLVALSGGEASFLAGGEFPVPVSIDSEDGTADIGIEFKEFGIQLKFLPVVLGDGTIHLSLSTEVSDISDVGAFEVSGFSIPSLLTRRFETTLEMNSGQSFAMAGLIDSDSNGRRRSIPWLGDLPVLGPMFRSIQYNRGETELVVLVTATLVEPLSNGTDWPLPGSAHVPPDDWQLFLDGRLEGDIPMHLPPIDAAWLKEIGIDRLRGPGAWVSYHQSPVPLRSSFKQDEPYVDPSHDDIPDADEPHMDEPHMDASHHIDTQHHDMPHQDMPGPSKSHAGRRVKSRCCPNVRQDPLPEVYFQEEEPEELAPPSGSAP